MLIDLQVSPKLTTPMIQISLYPGTAPRYVGRTAWVPKNARIFIAVAWVNNYDICTFMLFPEVFHADCNCDTNNTNNHLLTTFSCRTSTGKQVVFLWVWLPNQKRFSFRWVFKFVLTSIFDPHAFRRMQLVMVDGDPQQRSELSKVIMDYMPDAMDGDYGWQIVEEGWKAHGPGKTAVIEKKRDAYNLFKKRVKDWCYSWMTPGPRMIILFQKSYSSPFWLAQR
jgi:hypothetical protein